MNLRVMAAPRTPQWTLWLQVALVLTVGMAVNWGIATALVVLMLAQMARPYDYLTAFLLIVCGASLVYNEGGGMTLQLGLLTIVILVMLVFYALNMWERTLTIPIAPLTWPVLAYVGLSILNAGRGILVGYAPKWVNLELMPALALGTSLLVGNALDPKRSLRFLSIALVILGYVPAFSGFRQFSIEQGHTTGLYSAAGPGLVGLFCVNLALRSRSLPGAIGWLLVSLPLFLHQFVSFGRGLWTGCMGGFLAAIWIYTGGVRRGSGARWRRVVVVSAVVITLGVLGAIQAAIVSGRTDVLQEAGTRFGSITSTKEGIETQSNLIRIWEAFKVLGLIQQSPWIGYGLGYTFLARQPWNPEMGTQWGVHQNYLLVWLKQGLLGLGLFLWMLGTAVVVGTRESRRRDDFWESSWSASAATATVMLAVFSLTNYPFDVVNETFLLALLWGGVIAMTCTKRITLRWRAPDATKMGEPS
jgi:O-antigen ligase